MSRHARLLIGLYGSCFPHVVNIAVQTALKALSQSAPDPDPVSDRPEDVFETVDPVETIGLIDDDYALTLNADVVARVRELVRLCRSSSLRRAGFIAVVLEGNEQHWWGNDANGKPVKIDPLQLLRDVDTRWSSTYLMIDRVLKLVPVSPRPYLYHLQDYLLIAYMRRQSTASSTRRLPAGLTT